MRTEDEVRKAIIEEALTWCNTPFHDRAGIKNVGVDCAYLPIRVLNSVRFLPEEIPDPDPYSPQIMLHSKEELYLPIVKKYMHEIQESEVKPADFVLYRVGHSFSHGAIVIEWPNFVIHPVRDRGVIGSHGIEEGFLRRRPRRFFSLF